MATKPNPEKQDQQKGDRNRIRREIREFSRYYASTQSCARTPEERSVVTLRTASSSPEHSRHRCTRSSPKFSLRWLAAVELGTRTVRVDPSSSPPSNCSNQGGRLSRPWRVTRSAASASQASSALVSTTWDSADGADEGSGSSEFSRAEDNHPWSKENSGADMEACAGARVRWSLSLGADGGPASRVGCCKGRVSGKS